jgi:murein DD-endopeptidase MepM/ murein hydrolase activator NlpD
MPSSTGRPESRHHSASAARQSSISAGIALWVLALVVAAGMVQADPARDRDSLGVAAANGLGVLAVSPASAGARTPAAPQRRITEGVIQRGRTLSSLLRAQGVPPQAINQIAKGFKGHFDFRRAKPGEQFRLIQDGEGKVVEFRYRISSTESFTLRAEAGGFSVTRDEAELDARPTRIAGVVTSTLYQSITNLGEEGALARDFADIFAWDVDFQRAVHPGDSYQILYERLYRDVGGRETYVRPGRILAARFQGRSGDHTAIYFETEDGHGGYYRPNGSSVEGAFLMAPLRHGRITSNYSSARRHPILKITRPHRGIDYAASAGTPVWAVADGVVIHRGWFGGNGNLVKIKHRNGYVSSYAHLSRYAAGLKVGDRVDQKQVIGYVGQTGLATGPHVCFRIQQNGKYVDPAGLRMPSGPPIPGELVPTFRAQRDQLLGELAGERRVAGRR